MRILHTSDWHLGRSFHRVGHARAPGGLRRPPARGVESERVDLVVVAGDVYDRALPHVDAVRLADETFARLAASRARVVLTSGNHDSAQRLGFGSRLIDAAGVYVRTDASSVGTPVLLEDDHGPVAVHGIPYLDPQALHEPWQLPVPHPRGGAGRGDAPGPRRPGRAADALGGAGPRVRRRRRCPATPSATSASAASRWSSTVALRRHLLHRARPPPRPRRARRRPALQRVAAGLLLLRGRPHQGHAGWSTSGRDGVEPAEFVEAPVPRRLARAARRPRDAADRPGARRRPRTTGSRRRSPTPSGPAAPMERLRARFPARPGAGVRPRRRARAGVAGRRPRGAAATTRSRSTSWRPCAGRPATADESALLQAACDACADDPDADMLVSARRARLMRLHHLSVTAFGPFVETAEVDFDALSDAGLFLLSGATGAGKSSVLDAVCFALYGAVPGDRHHAGRLRSDQAPPGWRPQVALEVTLSGRRFRVVRSPAWERPKKRGTGTTREPAKVTLSPSGVGDDWVPPHQPARRGRRPAVRPARDEPRPVLPGGPAPPGPVPGVPARRLRRSDSQLLARLFRTGRFERVEGWLRDHRLALRRRSEAHARGRRRPGQPPVRGRARAGARRRSPTWRPRPTTALCRAGSRRPRRGREPASRGRRGGDAAAALRRGRRPRPPPARELATAPGARGGRGAETVERLDRRAATHHAADVARLDAARRAEGVRPLARLVDERAAGVRRGADDARERVARRAPLAPGSTSTTCSAELDAPDRRAGRR